MPGTGGRPAPAPATVLGWTLLLLVLGAVGGMTTTAMSLGMIAAQPHVFLLATAMATVTTVPYSLALLWLDRNEAEPLWLVATAFLWGALAATSLGGLANALSDGLGTALLGDPSAAHAFTVTVVAPIAEEAFKALAVTAVFVLFVRQADDVLDGIIYGAMVGLGFAWFENITYYVRVADRGVDAMLALAWLRGVLFGIGTHGTYTALTGLGLGLFRVMRRGPARWVMPPLGLGAAMVAHAVWNAGSGAYFGNEITELRALLVAGPSAVLGLQVPFLGLLGVVLGLSWMHEDQLIRRYLAQEPRDVVRHDEIDHLLPARRRVGRGLTTLGRAGPVAWWRHQQLTQALIKLAFERWHHAEDQLPWSADEDAVVGRLRQRVRSLRRTGARP
ncbi:MAG: PrsW family intramembrane metalloprotease [Alphaproteobacteria bacterium]|nr:PrsW family intramembrane metalloprotease [Alphaproteobacteria bacterium]